MNKYLISTLLAAVFVGSAQAGDVGAAGAVGGPGLALRAAKALVVPLEGPQVVDDAVVLVRDGVIQAVGAHGEVVIPEGYQVLDLGRQWVMPGMIELHNHIAGSLRDLNDMVYLTNPGLRSSTAVTPGNEFLSRALAAGVTAVLLIPGSGTNVGGQGVLVRTSPGLYEDVLIRDPGSLKLAQAGNPERFLFGIGRSFMNWNTRDTFVRGLAYAKRWEAFENGNGDARPAVDVQFEIFRKLYKREAQVATHTQIYQVVNATLTMIAEELKLPVFIDHGSFDGWRTAARAQELGVSAIVGPRAIDVPTAAFIRWSGSNPERIIGVAAGFQEQGHKMIGFNTDAPVIPQEELPLQAACAVRYGLDDSNLETVRGLTIVPAVTIGIQHRLGSLEVGKEADILVVTGDPSDPRSSVEQVFIRGARVYDTATERRRW
jgi:imidazolonepropionase-like amidohydrolase